MIDKTQDYKFIIKIQDYILCSAAKAGKFTEVENLIQSGAHVDSTEVSYIIKKYKIP